MRGGPRYNKPMQIFLNGDVRECDDGATLATLMADAGHAERRVAVEVNREIVPKSQHRAYVLSDGDRVEIVHAIGGG